MCRRGFCLTLVICFLFSVSVSLADSPVTESGFSELLQLEIQRAAGFGFDVSKIDDSRISGKDMMGILDHFVEIAAPDQMEQWSEKFPEMRSSKKPLNRADAMAACFLTADFLGGAYRSMPEDVFSEVTISLIDVDKEFASAPLSLDFYETYLRKYYNMGFGSTDLINAAYYFNLSRKSPFSGEFPFSYDSDKNTLHMNSAASYSDVVLAAVRMIDAADSDQFTSEDDEIAFHAVFSERVLNKANERPEVTSEKHPRWTGFCLLWELGSLEASEKALADISKWGFNAVRIYGDYRKLFLNGNVETPNYEAFRSLDRFISIAIDKGLHLILCISQLPGHALGSGAFNLERDMDLFVNVKKQKHADEIWRYITRRYRQIPNSCLSFSPVFEPSTGVYDIPYGIKEIANYTSHLIHVIREEDPERLLVYEATGVTLDIGDSPERVRKAIKDQDNLILIRNYAEEPFVYYNMMTDPEFNNADDVKHSMPCPDYPQYIYALNNRIDRSNSLTLEAAYPAGTCINIYLKQSKSAVIRICDSQGDELFKEKTGEKKYKTERPLSRYFPYAKSDGIISYTLEKPETVLTVNAASGNFDWCGIDVIFPEEYAVERWFNVTEYDVHIGLEKNAGQFLRKTSTVMIAPTPDEYNAKTKNNIVRIDSSLRYSSDMIVGEASPDFSAWWANTVKDLGVSSVVRFECADFSGAVWPNVMTYYDSLLSSFDKVGLSWFSNDYSQLTETDGRWFSQASAVSAFGYKHFNKELLELLQRHQ